MKGEKTPSPQPGCPLKKNSKNSVHQSPSTPEPCCHLREKSLYTAAKNLGQVGRSVLPESPCVFVGQLIWWAILNIQDHLTAAENLFPKEILFTALILGYLTYCLKEKSHSYLPDCQLPLSADFIFALNLKSNFRGNRPQAN